MQYQFKVSESNFQFSKASHHGFSVHIYESNIHDMKGWKKMMKSWGAKVDEKKHEFFADNANPKKWEKMCLIRMPFVMKKQITSNL